jgi:hypothetical protein
LLKAISSARSMQMLCVNGALSLGLSDAKAELLPLYETKPNLG